VGRLDQGDLVIERTIATGTHGRYLVEPPATSGAAPVLFGFHGYAEGAELQLERMRAIPGAGRWRLVAIQGLHRFYQRRDNQVIASWMTRQDRELAIADNLAYVAGVMGEVAAEWPGASHVVLAGFSQGVAMMFRAAAAASQQASGVIAVGGDVPPELDAGALLRVRSALVCRGTKDEWYTSDKLDEDVRRLSVAGAKVRPFSFEGGHDWSEEVSRAAAVFLAGFLDEPPR
jgi:predicted esterase